MLNATKTNTSNNNNDQIINYYNDLCISIYIAISKINANIQHGQKYGILSNKIPENFITLFEYNIVNHKDITFSNIIHNRNKQLKNNLSVLNNILEKQRMCFVVNYFCDNKTKSAFPKYLIPILKKKYIKLYSNIIFESFYSEIYFINYDLIDHNIKYSVCIFEEKENIEQDNLIENILIQ